MQILTSTSAIADKPCCNVGNLWQKYAYKCQKHASNIALWPEVEIWPYRACLMKNMQYLILKIGRFVRLQSESRTAGMPVTSQCRLYETFSIAASSHDFGLRRCTGSAFMLVICFRLPLSVAALHRSVQYDSGSQPGLSISR